MSLWSLIWNIQSCTLCPLSRDAEKVICKDLVFKCGKRNSKLRTIKHASNGFVNFIESFLVHFYFNRSSNLTKMVPVIIMKWTLSRIHLRGSWNASKSFALCAMFVRRSNWQVQTKCIMIFRKHTCSKTANYRPFNRNDGWQSNISSTCSDVLLNKIKHIHSWSTGFTNMLDLNTPPHDRQMRMAGPHNFTQVAKCHLVCDLILGILGNRNRFGT